MDDEQEQKRITMSRDIAEIFNKNGTDCRHAEPILWIVLSNVYSHLKKKYGISKDEITGLIDEHKKEILKEIPLDVDEGLKKLL
ncbi:MAG TPA: hypothetical protein VEH06_01830 [Candidatus Bathyarchaeia archaeon]|nr:hypothetical protein [Candidatus Bathyarchaeia archaeon]